MRTQSAPVNPSSMLITPHGDRKRSASRQSAVPVADSLPLMGIENRRRNCRRRPARGTHYPSWGSKTIQDVVAKPGLQNCSLPLMGIENTVTAAPASRRCRISLPLMGIENEHGQPDARRCDYDLITPHGDRKLVGSGTTGARTTAHYPSWGSKTRARRAVPDTEIWPSLPLMGIENRPNAVPACLPACPSLPLMGIENEPVVRWIEQRYPVSLPLMGIENHRNNILDRSHARNSLPLMGIENLY